MHDLWEWGCDIVDGPNKPLGEDCLVVDLLNNNTMKQMARACVTSLDDLKARVLWVYWGQYGMSVWEALQVSLPQVEVEEKPRRSAEKKRAADKKRQVVAAKDVVDEMVLTAGEASGSQAPKARGAGPGRLCHQNQLR